ncbi:MAG: hypothetical protein HUU34_18715 [Saprospiraceae bacterium]|nr:hypothetical protein [Saprospiraceae bacterium]
MNEYAVDHFHQDLILNPNESKSITFGSPTPGELKVLLSAKEVLESPLIRNKKRRTTTTLNKLTDSFSLSTSGSLSNTSSDPTNSDTNTEGIDDGVASISPKAFRIEILDADGKVMYSGDGPLIYEVPKKESPFPSAEIDINFIGPKWSIRITNNSRFKSYVNLNILYRGHRPIITKDIDLEFLNEKLDSFFNASQPIQISFENRQVGTVQINNSTVPIIHTFVKLEVDPAWEEWYPILNNLEKDLGGHVFIEVTKTYRITAKATIIDGSLALKLDISFPSFQGKIDLLNLIGGAVKFVGDLIVNLTPADRPTVSINDFVIELFFVLRPNGAFGVPIKVGPHIETIARPRINLNFSIFDKYLDIATHLGIQYVFEQILPSHTQQVLQETAINLLGWLLGDRNRTVVGNIEHLSLKYAGDEPMQDVLMPAYSVSGIPQIPLEPGNLSKIDHIVVLMMENRSFDHMLGFLSLPTTGNNGRVGLGRSEVSGLHGNESNPINTDGVRRTVFPLSEARVGSTLDNPKNETRGTKFPFSPGHDFSSTKTQRGNYTIDIPPKITKPELDLSNDPNNGGINDLDLEDFTKKFTVGPNEGFIFDFEKRLRGKVSANDENILRREIMGYHPKEHVPVYHFLAEQYGVCDRWFASHPGHTIPNRFVTMMGRLAMDKNGKPQVNNPDLSTFDPLEDPTIFDHLTAAGIEWRYYEHDFGMLRLYSKYTFDRQRVVSIDDLDNGFFALAKKGSLPSVTFIDPDFGDIPGGNDDQPPTDIQKGQELVHKIYSALANGPKKQWNKTLFIIVYDEHGGFYDHIHPQEQVIFDPKQPDKGKFVPLALDPISGDPINYYGMRVPALLISPWIPPKTVFKDEVDHTTILKTIITRFLHNNPPDMGARVALSKDLGAALSLNMPQILVPTPDISLNPKPTLVNPEKEHTSVEDFREFMIAFSKQVRKR